MAQLEEAVSFPTKKSPGIPDPDVATNTTQSPTPLDQNITPIIDRASNWVAQGNKLENFPDYDKLGVDALKWIKNRMASASMAGTPGELGATKEIITPETHVYNTAGLAQAQLADVDRKQPVAQDKAQKYTFPLTYGSAPSSAIPPPPVLGTPKAPPPTFASGSPTPMGDPGARPYDQAKATADVATKAVNAVSALKGGNKLIPTILALIPDIMDAIGAGKLAFAGIQSPTRLEKEYDTSLAIKQKRGEAQAEKESTLAINEARHQQLMEEQANQAKVSLDAELAKIDPQLRAAIELALQTNNYEGAKAIAVGKGLEAVNKALINAQYMVDILKGQTPANKRMDVYAAGKDIFKAPGAEGG